jgi:flagellar protein FlaG
MDVNNIITNKFENITQTRSANIKNAEHVLNESVIPESDIPLTKEYIDNSIDALNSAAKSVNQRVSFAFDDKTNRVILKFIDGDTNEVIREIPPKEMIRLLERMHDLIGMFVDESR